MSDAEFEKIEVARTHDERVLRVTLATPPANILDGQALAEIATVVDRAAAEPQLRAIVFAAQGKHFSFGASVEEHRKEAAGKMIHSFHALFKKIVACPVPTIALVRGQCLGGGMELVTFCNFILAEPSARFGQPEIVLAVFPPVAAVILPRLVGQARADDLILTGRVIDAETAQQWGMVHAVGDDGEAELEKLLSKHLVPKSAMALRFANRAGRAQWNVAVTAELDAMEKLYVDELMATEDAVEGIESFLAKRSPEWKDR